MSTEIFRFDNFLTICARLKNELSVKKDKDLIDIIGTKQPTFSRRKVEDKFNIEWAFIIAQKYGLSTDWILTGKWPKPSEFNDKLDKVLASHKTREFNEGYITDKESIIFDCSWNGKFVKKVIIKVGGLYLIDPINPKRKNYQKNEVELIKYSESYGCEVLIPPDDPGDDNIRNYDFLCVEPCDLKNIDEDDKNRFQSFKF